MKRRSKYGNEIVTYEGEVFHSKAELNRWKELKLLEAAKEITELERQPEFPLQIYGEVVCKYVGDFAYKERGQPTVEDVKGFPTDVYKLKRKLFEILYKGVKFVEIKAR